MASKLLFFGIATLLMFSVEYGFSQSLKLSNSADMMDDRKMENAETDHSKEKPVRLNEVNEAQRKANASAASIGNERKRKGNTINSLKGTSDENATIETQRQQKVQGKRSNKSLRDAVRDQKKE